MIPRSAATLLLVALAPLTARAESYEQLEKSSVPVLALKRVLFPFVATCDREKNHFRKLFCSALNERLKAQHQAKLYRSSFEPSEAGPLIVRFKAKPKPAMELEVKGCLTCKEPMLERAGGDIAKGRFFLFKTPEEIKIRRGKLLYDLGEIGIGTTRVELPAKMTEAQWTEEIRPFLRLDLLYRPIAGVTMVGKRIKYGVIQFELVGHRVYDRCGGKVHAVTPKMSGKLFADRKDMTCPQNRPKKVAPKKILPAGLPKSAVAALMQQVEGDLRACYEMFGAIGEVPAEILVTPEGKVKSVKVGGKLAGSSTAQCVERLVKETSFPAFAGDEAKVQWPFVIRN
jgi:hypothetical protein